MTPSSQCLVSGVRQVRQRRRQQVAHFGMQRALQLGRHGVDGVEYRHAEMTVEFFPRQLHLFAEARGAVVVDHGAGHRPDAVVAALGQNTMPGSGVQRAGRARWDDACGFLSLRCHA